MTDSTNWEARGISWTEEVVSELAGDHATDKRELGKAQIPVVKDLTAFVKEYGEAAVLGSLDGTSIRVMAQDVNRTGLRKKLTKDEIRQRIDGRLRGIRARGVPSTKEVTVYALPDGTKYTGTNEVEFQAAYMAALVDQGVDASVAQVIATSQHLA